MNPRWRIGAPLALALALALSAGPARAATDGPAALAQADALVVQASAAYDDPGQVAAARQALTRALRTLDAARLSAEARDLARSRVLYTWSWVEASARQPDRARRAARQALRAAQRWRPPGAPDVLWPRQALFAHAVQAQHWARAHQALRPLMPYLDFDGQRCGDELCAAVLTQRSMLHAALGETALAYTTRLASHRFLDAQGLRSPIQLAWDELSLAHLAFAQGQTALALEWLDAVERRAAQAGLPADAPMVAQARALRPAWADTLTPRSPADWQAARAQALQDDAAAVAARGWLDEHRAALLQACARASLPLGDTAGGLRCAAEAVAVAWGQPGDVARLDEVHALQQLGQIARQAGARQAAVLLGKSALNALQQQRARLHALPAALQARHLALWQSSYQQLADDLLEDGRLAEAEQVLALARSAEFHALVRGPAAPALLHLSPAEQHPAETLRALRAQLRQAGGPRAAGPGGAARPAVLDQALTRLLAWVQAPPEPRPDLTADDSAAGAPGAEGEVPRVLYLPGPGHLRVAVQASGRRTVHDVDVSEAALLTQVAALRQAAQDPGRDPRPAAQALYALLWAPLAAELPAQAPRVRIQAEGVLRYLPFGLLHDGEHWLLERHALVLSAGEGRPDAPPRAHRGWALLGSARSPGLPALPQVPAELKTLAALAPRQPPPELRLDAAFTRDRLRRALTQRQVVHIASHFRLVPGDAQASWLQLGQGQRVSLAELARPGFDFRGVELLTLSACETAVPAGTDARGSALDSLAQVALLRGARQVLASLWTVPDEDTAQLMQDVYRAYADGLPAPEALRQAQRRRLQAAPHPSAWGGFVLMASP